MQSIVFLAKRFQDMFQTSQVPVAGDVAAACALAAMISQQPDHLTCPHRDDDLVASMVPHAGFMIGAIVESGPPIRGGNYNSCFPAASCSDCDDSCPQRALISSVQRRVDGDVLLLALGGSFSDPDWARVHIRGQRLLAVDGLALPVITPEGRFEMVMPELGLAVVASAYGLSVEPMTKSRPMLPTEAVNFLINFVTARAAIVARRYALAGEVVA
ncbi:MAG: hypothetical protein B7Y35_14035 [Sphingomonadales bacterium 28-64-96]|nr:MAG: hypothetical protein B7Y35_14035 [Sphingomonadales bacterium 28-64-96]